MACNCKHNQEAINDFYKMIKEFREMFIKRMTVDSETQDRRRKDFNQAIFHYYSKQEIDEWNEYCKDFPHLNLQKREFGSSYPVWDYIDINMILECFDNAIKDYRRSFCDVDGCNRK